jgi:hypothetical protein
MKLFIIAIAIMVILFGCTPSSQKNQVEELVIYGFPFLEPDVMLA